MVGEILDFCFNRQYILKIERHLFGCAWKLQSTNHICGFFFTKHGSNGCHVKIRELVIPDPLQRIASNKMKDDSKFFWDAALHLLL